jgi:hypothetical protein
LEEQVVPELQGVYNVLEVVVVAVVVYCNFEVACQKMHHSFVQRLQCVY